MLIYAIRMHLNQKVWELLSQALDLLHGVGVELLASKTGLDSHDQHLRGSNAHSPLETGDCLCQGY